MRSHITIKAQPLPFAYDALAAHGIPSEQLKDHYHRHHCAYAAQLDGLVCRDSALCTIVDTHDFESRRLALVADQQQQKRRNQKKKGGGGEKDEGEGSVSGVAPVGEETNTSSVNSSASASSSPAATNALITALTPAEALMLKVPKGSHAANLASMVVNHDFFWKCLAGEEVGGGGSSAPSPASSVLSIGPETTSYSLVHRSPTVAHLLSFVERDFGSVRSMMSTFETAALSLFGSGWVWLAWSRSGNNTTSAGRLVVLTTRDSINPLQISSSNNNNNSCGGDFASSAVPVQLRTHEDAVKGAQYIPILGCDMWEHAFMVHGAPSVTAAANMSVVSDNTADKRRYLRKFWASANWAFAAANFEELVRVGGWNGPRGGAVADSASGAGAAAGPSSSSPFTATVTRSRISRL